MFKYRIVDSSGYVIREIESGKCLDSTDEGTLTGLAYPGDEAFSLHNDGEECALELWEKGWFSVRSFRINSNAVAMDRLLFPETDADWDQHMHER